MSAFARCAKAVCWREYHLIGVHDRIENFSPQHLHLLPQGIDLHLQVGVLLLEQLDVHLLTTTTDPSCQVVLLTGARCANHRNHRFRLVRRKEVGGRLRVHLFHAGYELLSPRGTATRRGLEGEFAPLTQRDTGGMVRGR